MERRQSATQPLNCSKVASNQSFTNRPRASMECQEVNNPRINNIFNSDNLSKGLESMLKKTTETGDIGVFSIKPSRALQPAIGPCSASGLQKSSQSFEPYGVPGIDDDDRRRLPSYSRDTSSDVTPMYDTMLQSPVNRGIGEPSNRSYSMTHASTLSYTLSNHKSYASLRSQQDTSGAVLAGGTIVVQRPKSPFAYPTRLKRPGFRPSSPALTDGGGVDYSRRAEIDRFTYASDYKTSSPSSLYALKRVPPLALRSEANRSTPSILSQSSPHRRSSSPQTFISTGHDGSRRNGIASINTSPARSTFSLASTMTFYAPGTTHSVTAIPGRIIPSSPLYYDYTEDFEVEDYHPSEFLPPPTFAINMTIPLERPIDANPSPTEVPALGVNYNNGIKISMPESRYIPRPNKATLKPGAVAPHGKAVGSYGQLIRHHEPEIHTSTAYQTNGARGSTVKYASLTHGARELSDHVEEAFGLNPSGSVGFSVHQPDLTNIISSSEGNETGIHLEKHNKVLCFSSTRSTQISSTVQPCFSATRKSSTLSRYPSQAVQPQDDTPIRESLEFTHKSSQSRRTSRETIVRKELPVGASIVSPRSHALSNGFSIMTESTDLFGLNKYSEGKPEARYLNPQPPILRSPKQEYLKSPLPLGRPTLSHAPSDQDPLAPILLVNTDSKEACNNFQQQERDCAKDYHTTGTVSDPKAYKKWTENLPNFRYQMAKSMGHQASPIIAPRPISPARQLKLKSSIPHLMKALPPLPPELECQGVLITADSKPSGNGFLRLSSPVARTDFQNITLKNGENLSVDSMLLSTSAQTTKVSDSVLDFHPQAEFNKFVSMPPLPPPKIKLKLRASNTPCPPLPRQQVSSNFDEDLSWENQTINSRLSPTIQKKTEGNQKRPRFRLKATRASLSTSGTVRVNRHSRNAKSAALFHLKNSKDLFASTSTLEGVFRQVNKHIHSRKTSTVSSLGLEVTPGSVPAIVPLQSQADEATNTGFERGNSVPSSTGMNLGQARSCFSYDSSQEEGQDSLRRRMTSLRSRIDVPCVLRAGMQSHDHIVCMDRNGVGGSTPAAVRPIPNLPDGSRESTDSNRTRRFTERLQPQNLKWKMQDWIKSARVVIAVRGRQGRQN